MVPLKYLHNFSTTLAMSLINCDVILILNWYKVMLFSNALAAPAKTFATNNARRYLPVVTLSTQENVELFEQLKSGFKRAIN